MTGQLITLEGGEGVGKTTNLAFIERYFDDRGIPLLKTREPGGTPLGENIRELLLQGDAMDLKAELLLVFAARAQHVAAVIRPALSVGTWVLSDRFTDASYAYQGGGRGLSLEMIETLERWVQDMLQPDLTLLLDLPVETGMARAKDRGRPDRFESEQLDFFERVRAAYVGRAKAYPQRFRRIDASQALETVQAQIKSHLDAFLERQG
ncbi:MAG: dTMP kinase [Methylococcus sp.]|jgi:dTMP kinase|nr:MAG: dTMP kinase [Methylococcus sp.]